MPRRTTTPIGPTVIILGPQGAGKGTQAELLARKYRFVHLESGAMLREEERRNTPFGKRIARIIDQGKLVPFTWVLRLIAEQLEHIPLRRGIVIDGSPRRMPEAKQLVCMLDRRFGRAVTTVIVIDISKAETIRRLSKRWTCTRQHPLIMGVHIRRSTDKCPICHSPVEQRKDDRPEAIVRRLAIFQRQTQPVIRYFTSLKLLHRVDGRQPIPAVFRQVDHVFRKGTNGPRAAKGR